MERFVLAGKAKTVFQMIELMAKGEALIKRQKEEAAGKIAAMKADYQQIRFL